MVKKSDDLVDEYMQHILMNETRAYLARGRALADQDDAEVKDVWVAAFERWFAQKTAENGQDMEDAAAELRLRHLDLPYYRVQSKVDELQAIIGALSPETPSESLDALIDEFQAARSRPKN